MIAVPLEGIPSLRVSGLNLEPWPGIRDEWKKFASECPESTIYQDDRWVEALRGAFSLRFVAATIRNERGEILGGAVFGKSKIPFRHRLTSLPCSDSAPPLASSKLAEEKLLTSLAESRLAGGGLEIRGIAAPRPWQVENCFAQWLLNLDRTPEAIERTMATNFRRQVQRGRRADLVIEVDRTLEGMKRFHKLMLTTRRRLGLPSQPWKFFALVHQLFSPNGDIEVWIASQHRRPVAAAVLILDRNAVHFKWSARLEPTPAGANHRLLTELVQHYAGRFAVLEMGRTDVRNAGLNRFKRELGAKPSPLPYSFLPQIPGNVSAEVLDGSRARLSQIWRRLPLPVTRVLGSALYRYLV